MSQTNLPQNTQSTNPKAIQIQNLTKVYSAKGKTPFQALSGVNLEVEAGDFFSLLGANGAGKTTIKQLEMSKFLVMILTRTL